MAAPARRSILTGLLAFAASPVLAQTAAPPTPGPAAGTGPGPGAGYGVRQGGGPGGPMGGGPGMGRGPRLGMMTDPAGYLDGLKAQLGITEPQAPAWTAYAETVTGVAGQMQGIRQSMWESMPTASWEERQGMMNTMFQARQQAFTTVHDAAAKLLPALTSAQRQQAQGMLPGLMAHGPGQGRGMGRGMGPGMMRQQGAPPG